MRLMQTQDEERRHIARDLHECAGQSQTLAALVMICRRSTAKRSPLLPKLPGLSTDGRQSQNWRSSRVGLSRMGNLID
jgi:signal transduction histidine kinase